MRKGVDLLFFWGVLGTLGVAHSLLLTINTAWQPVTLVYILMWLCSLVTLAWCRMYYGEAGLIDYDEPLTKSKLIYIPGALAAIMIVNAVLLAGYARSSIWVPQPRMALQMSALSLNELVNDVFYQLGLVANAEETMCLALSQILMVRLSNHTFKRQAALYLPRVGWGILHAYQSYTGPLMPIMVLAATISGCIISYAAYNGKTKCFLIAVLTHFIYNTIVILQPYLTK